MDQFKVLAQTLLYSSLRVLYNENKHKGIQIKNLVTFLKQPTLTAQGNVRLQQAHHHTFIYLTATTRRSLLTSFSLNLWQIKELYALGWSLFANLHGANLLPSQ